MSTQCESAVKVTTICYSHVNWATKFAQELRVTTLLCNAAQCEVELILTPFHNRYIRRIKEFQMQARFITVSNDWSWCLFSGHCTWHPAVNKLPADLRELLRRRLHMIKIGTMMTARRMTAAAATAPATHATDSDNQPSVSPPAGIAVHVLSSPACMSQNSKPFRADTTGYWISLMSCRWG